MAPAEKPAATGGLNGVEKAAILIMSLDEEVAAKIFGMMTEEEIRRVSQCMSSLGKVESQQVDGLITEFSDELASGKSIIGDINNAKKLLTKALGADKVETIISEIGGPVGRDTWDRLNNVDEELLAAYLRNEYPQTAALILSKIKTSHAAKVLATMPDEIAIEVVRRMINLEPVKREVINDIEKILQSEFMTSLAQSKKSDSLETIAEIFNNFDRSTESKFFEMLELKSPGISERIRELMFTFEDLIKLLPPAIQAIIRSADKAKLPIALKGANEDIKNLFFSNMSERASKLLKEEIASLGPVRISEVDEAQMSIVATAKQLADSGEIVIPEGNEEEEQMIE